MKVVDAIAEMLKREGVEFIVGYPVNPLFDGVSRAGIRPIVVRQERIGIHMADAFSRLNSGKKVGVFTMQSGPGTENAYGAVAQAYSEGVPLVVIPGGYARHLTNIFPNFSANLSYRDITKWCEPVIMPNFLHESIRRAFTQAKNGRPGPTLVEIPADVWNAEVDEPLVYHPSILMRSAPDPTAVEEVAEALIDAERPLIYAGQGVHYAQAWDELKELAELLEAPVTTSLEGKSAFPENHPLSLGSGGRAMPGQVYQHVQDADLIFGIGCSFSRTSFGIQFPQNKRYIQATVDPIDVNKDIPVTNALIGDAKLTLRALADAVGERLHGQTRGRQEQVVSLIKTQRDDWMQKWMPKLTTMEAPFSPHHVLWELQHNVDVANTVITHDAGSPRDQLSPFWAPTTPLSYIGWGKTTQLGYGLGLAMGAKLAQPDKLCINVWGDAAIGMTGMDFETCVRENIPILSILMNNFTMAIELRPMAHSTEHYRSTDISGDYASFARALGGYGERITDPAEIGPAIQRGIKQTLEGRPALLEFITAKDYETSTFDR